MQYKILGGMLCRFFNQDLFCYYIEIGKKLFLKGCIMKRIVTICFVVVALTCVGWGQQNVDTSVRSSQNQQMRGLGNAESLSVSEGGNAEAGSVSVSEGGNAGASSDSLNINQPNQSLSITNNYPQSSVRTPPVGAPYWIPPNFVPYQQGPMVFGGTKNSQDMGVEVVTWDEEDFRLMKRSEKELRQKGILGLFGEIGDAVFNGKSGLRARGFSYTRTIQKCERAKNHPIIIVSYKHKLTDSQLLKAGYVYAGAISIDSPPRYKGVVIDEEILRAFLLNELHQSNIDLALYFEEAEPVAESKSGYFPGVSMTTNDTYVGATLGGGSI